MFIPLILFCPSAQLIELLHAEEEATGKLPTGYVLANDADNKRCYLMMHQVRTQEICFCSPLILINKALYIQLLL